MCICRYNLAGHTLLTPAHVLRGSMELWRRNPAYSTWNIEHWHTAQWHTAHVLRGSVRFQTEPHYSGQSLRLGELCCYCLEKAAILKHRCILGRCAENQNGNLRWHLP